MSWRNHPVVTLCETTSTTRTICFVKAAEYYQTMVNFWHSSEGFVSIPFDALQNARDEQNSTVTNIDLDSLKEKSADTKQAAFSCCRRNGTRGILRSDEYESTAHSGRNSCKKTKQNFGFLQQFFFF